MHNTGLSFQNSTFIDFRIKTTLRTKPSHAAKKATSRSSMCRHTVALLVRQVVVHCVASADTGSERSSFRKFSRATGLMT